MRVSVRSGARAIEQTLQSLPGLLPVRTRLSMAVFQGAIARGQRAVTNDGAAQVPLPPRILVSITLPDLTQSSRRVTAAQASHRAPPAILSDSTLRNTGGSLCFCDGWGTTHR